MTLGTTIHHDAESTNEELQLQQTREQNYKLAMAMAHSQHTYILVDNR